MTLVLNLAALRGFGSGIVGRNVLREMALARHGVPLEAWVPEAWGWQPSELVGVNLHFSGAGAAAKLLTENITIRRALRASRPARLFSMGDTSLPGPGVPHLLLVQQPYLAYGPAARDFPMTAGFRRHVRLMELYFRLALPGVTTITVQTHAMRRRLAARWGFPLERIAVVPSAVAAPVPAERPVVDDAPYVCYVASPAAHKNHTVLADMMAELKRSAPALRCALTVEPEQVPALVARAESLRVFSNFRFLGGLSHPAAARLMADAVAVVMPSRLESFGLPYYEAMALGCPVVAANRDFAHEACGDAGLYAPADDGATFAAHVLDLFQSSQYRSRYAGRMRERFTTLQRTWADVAADYLRLLDALGER